jgi:hypothetical protein
MEIVMNQHSANVGVCDYEVVGFISPCAIDSYHHSDSIELYVRTFYGVLRQIDDLCFSNH